MIDFNAEEYQKEIEFLSGKNDVTQYNNALLPPLQNGLLTEEYQNSLTELSELVGGAAYGMSEMSKTDTLAQNLRGYMVTNIRNLLSQAYIELGLVQSLIDVPIDDGFKKLPTPKTDQLDEEEIKELLTFMFEYDILDKYKAALRWKSLFGGAGIVIHTSQNPILPFDIKSIKKGFPIEFYVADRWELCFQPSGVVSGQSVNNYDGISDTPYNYYGQTFHKSRVLKFIGKEAPSILRLQLMGWGMSELERAIIPINAYYRDIAAIFELVKEVKVSVWKIEGYNNSLATKGGSEKIARRISASDKIKSFLNSITMDTVDDFVQRQITFSGLPEMIQEAEKCLASALRRPLTKIFGVSAAGFNAGDDDIENYNSMIESEVRGKHQKELHQLFLLCCQLLFGFAPTDLRLEHEPLRTLTHEQEENVKNQKYNRTIGLYNLQLMTDEETISAVNNDALVSITVDEKKGIKQESQNISKDSDVKKEIKEEGKLKETKTANSKKTEVPTVKDADSEYKRKFVR